MIKFKDGIIMTQYRFESWINQVVRSTEYEELVRALAFRYIADRPSDVVSSMCNVAHTDLLSAYALIKKHMIVSMDREMGKCEYDTIYANHMDDIEEMRQILIDNKFTYLPLDAKVYKAIQIGEMTWEDAKDMFKIPVPLLRRMVSNAIYRYFESHCIPQPLFTVKVSYEPISVDDMIKLANLSKNNNKIVTAYTIKGMSIEEISEQFRVDIDVVNNVIMVAMSDIAAIMKRRCLRLDTNSTHNNLLSGKQGVPFYYKCSMGTVSA